MRLTLVKTRFLWWECVNRDRAISQQAFNSVFTIELGQILLKNQIVKLIVFDEKSEAILQWIPD